MEFQPSTVASCWREFHLSTVASWWGEFHLSTVLRAVLCAVLCAEESHENFRSLTLIREGEILKLMHLWLNGVNVSKKGC